MPRGPGPWLTDEIARNALTLVTDPFGNYVVQYVLDLNVEHMVRKVRRGPQRGGGLEIPQPPNPGGGWLVARQHWWHVPLGGRPTSWVGCS